jgi:hypothetical protein
VITRDFLTRGGMSQDPGAPDVTKARRPKRRDGEPATMAHEQAEGTMDGLEDDHVAAPGAAKGYEHLGIGSPGRPMYPGEPIQGPDFRRGPITGGHAALSPGHEPPNTAPVPEGSIRAQDFQRPALAEGHAAVTPSRVPHVDLSGSRAGWARPVLPPAAAPGGSR